MTPTRASSKERGTRRGKARIRPRARLIRLMGEELISNQIIALVELIKNAYDADASTVNVTFVPPLTRGQGEIVVEDDGEGMSLGVLRNAWMEPATSMKVQSPKSRGGRRVTGEKGIGRFAAARLAGILDVLSVKDRRRVSATFDWATLTDSKRYLDEVRVSWKEQTVPRGTPSGTVLRLEGLKDDWSYEQIQRLRGELARLIIRHGGTDPFEIQLHVPEGFGDLGGAITAPAVLGRPHYSLSGEIAVSGAWRGHLTVHGEATAIRGAVKIVDPDASDGEPRPPRCGAFSFDIRAWDRDTEAIRGLADELGESTRSVRRDLNEACGVSIYRDGFRVLPYGGSDNDWLRLDLRRVQNPSLRLSNNQIVGDIHITADGNPGLKDQTSREGLVESVALSDLKECVKELLQQIEERRFSARRPARDEKQPWIRDLDPEPLRAEFKRLHPDDKEFAQFLDAHIVRIKTGIERVQQTIVQYRRLATLGQLVDVVMHDGRTPLAAIKNDCLLASRDLERAIEEGRSREQIIEAAEQRFSTITSQAEVLLTLFRRLEPFGRRKRGRPIEQAIEKMIADVFAIRGRELDAASIRRSLPTSKTIVTADPAEMQLLFMNLLDNALYWLKQAPPQVRAIAVQVRRVPEGVEILFSDSGPGVAEDIEDRIFEPYFTTKRDGVGLGLAIAGEMALEYNGSLALVRPGPLPGATFRLLLGKRTGHEEDDE